MFLWPKETFVCVNLSLEWNLRIEENQRSLEISLGKIINQIRNGGPLELLANKKVPFWKFADSAKKETGH